MVIEVARDQPPAAAGVPLRGRSHAVGGQARHARDLDHPPPRPQRAKISARRARVIFASCTPT